MEHGRKGSALLGAFLWYIQSDQKRFVFVTLFFWINAPNVLMEQFLKANVPLSYIRELADHTTFRSLCTLKSVYIIYISDFCIL